MIVPVVLFVLAIIVVLTIRNEFRNSVKPFQIVGAKIDGQVRNVSVLLVNKELKVVTVSDPMSKKKIDIALSNIYAPTFHE